MRLFFSPAEKRSLEYLFYGQDPLLPGEIMRVAEEVLRSLPRILLALLLQKYMC